MNQDKEVRYSAANPPPTPELARYRLEKVAGAIAKIKSNLETKVADAFPDFNAFRNWKYRARNARFYYETEERFLTEWLRRENQKHNDTKLEALNIRMSAKVSKLLASVSYEILYTQANLPRSIEDAKKRHNILSDGKSDLSKEASDIEAYAMKLGMQEKSAKRVTAPVRTFIIEVDKELKVISWYLKAATTGQLDTAARIVKNPELHQIDVKLTDLRQKIGRSDDCVVWLLLLVQKYQNNLSLSPSETEMLGLIGQRIQLIRRRSELDGSKSV